MFYIKKMDRAHSNAYTLTVFLLQKYLLPRHATLSALRAKKSLVNFILTKTKNGWQSVCIKDRFLKKLEKGHTHHIKKDWRSDLIQYKKDDQRIAFLLLKKFCQTDKYELRIRMNTD